MAAPASPAPDPANRYTLTNAAQILQLSAKETAALPARIHGMVTCYDDGWIFFVQDETAGVFVYYCGSRLPLRPGQYVEVTGFARQGRYSPIIDAPVIRPLESGPHIAPRSVSLAQISLGGLDAQWVELSGVVSMQEIVNNRLRLELSDQPHRIQVWLSEFKGYEQLLLPGCFVRIRAVVGTSVDDHGRLAAFQLYANSLADVTILRRPASDPFTLPVLSVSDFGRYHARSGATGQLHVQGVVTLCWPDRTLFLQDASGGLQLRTRTLPDQLSPGARIDAVGFPDSAAECSLLDDALIRRLGTNSAPKPIHLTPDDLATGSHQHELVEIEAQLLGLHASSNTLALELEADNHFLSARLVGDFPRSALETLPQGCRLSVTGVFCRGSGSGVASTSAVLLRSISDLRLLGLPPSNPNRYLLGAACSLTSIGLAIMAWWLRLDRRRIRQMLKTQTLLQAEMRQGQQQLQRSMEERERIGRDLHDDIIQSIYSVGLSLEDCRRVVRQAPDQAEPRLASAIRTLNDTIRSVRGFIAGLEPKVLNGREFKTALKSLALTSGDGPTQFQIDVDPAAANALTSTQATQLLHIAKEAMSNSLRHAQASQVTVSLHSIAAGVRLEIHDDGVGFDPAAVGAKGQGLRNINARAREIGAQLQLISAPGQGCSILVVAPRQEHE